MCFKNNNVLRLNNPSYESLLEVDSSGYGLGGILMQRKNNEHPWHPAIFVSRTLNDAEKNYSNIEREAMAVIFCCEKLAKYYLANF